MPHSAKERNQKKINVFFEISILLDCGSYPGADVCLQGAPEPARRYGVHPGWVDLRSSW